MNFGDVIRTPELYWLFAFALAGGYYAKGKLVDALFFAWIAQLMLLPAYFAALFATSLPLGVLHKAWPATYRYMDKPDDWFEMLIGYAVNPCSWATFITVVAFAAVCHFERSNQDLPMAKAQRRRRRAVANPMKRPPAAPARRPIVRRSQ